MRKLSFESTPKFVAALKDDAAQREALDIVLVIMGDRSWRVRHCVSERVSDVAQAFGPAITRCALQQCSKVCVCTAYPGICLCLGAGTAGHLGTRLATVCLFALCLLLSCNLHAAVLDVSGCKAQ